MIRWIVATVLALLHGHTCVATVFGYRGDLQRGGNAACLHRQLRPDEIGVAHRTLPCGTEVALFNPRTKRMVVATVVDHGPYGATDEDGDWVLKRFPEERGRWRGCLDVTRRAAELLGHNGFERLLWAALPVEKE